MESLITSLQDLLTYTLAGMSAMGVLLFWLLIATFGLLWAFFIRIYIAYCMARNRHRDPLGWVLLSFFVSPLLTWCILLIAGNADQS